MADRRRPGRVLDHPKDLCPPFPSVEGAPVRSAEEKGDDPDPVAQAVARGTEEGFREGWRKASEQFEADVKEYREQMASTLKQLAALEESLTRQHEALLLEVAVEAASRIVRERVESDDPVAVRALKEAMEALPDTAGLRARLHPDDLESASKELAAELESGRIELAADGSLSRGGCVVESAVGTVDATLGTALETVRETALGAEEIP